MERENGTTGVEEVSWVEGRGDEEEENVEYGLARMGEAIIRMIESDGEEVTVDSDEEAEVDVHEDYPKTWSPKSTIVDSFYRLSLAKLSRVGVREYKQTIKRGNFGILSFLLQPVKSLWTECFHKKKSKAICSLASKYYEIVACVFGEEGIPAEVMVMFEAISDNSQISSKRPSPNATSPPETPGSFQFGDVKRLDHLMETSLALFSEMQKINSCIQDELSRVGFIEKDTDLFNLVLDYNHEVGNLRNRLSVANSMIGRNVRCHVKDENVTNVIDLKYSLSPLELGKVAQVNLSYSMTVKVEEGGLLACASLVKAIVVIAYYYTLPCKATDYDLHLNRLGRMMKDIGLLVDSSRRKFQLFLETFNEKMEFKKKQDVIKAVSFSKENQIRRLSQKNVDLIQALTKCLNFISTQSSYLAESGLFPQSQAYKATVEILKDKQLTADSILLEINHLMESQSIMISGLSVMTNKAIKSNSEDEVETENKKTVNADSEIDEEIAAESKPVYGYSLNSNGDQDEEFQTDDGDCPVTNPDEVFIAVFSDESERGQGTSGYDDVENFEENQHKRLYSGVVSQLKSALQPVKETMEKREQEAVTKRFGTIESESLSDDRSDGSDSTVESQTHHELKSKIDYDSGVAGSSAESGDSVSRSVKVGIPRCEQFGDSDDSSSEEDGREQYGCGPRNDLLKELMEKLQREMRARTVTPDLDLTE